MRNSTPPQLNFVKGKKTFFSAVIFLLTLFLNRSFATEQGKITLISSNINESVIHFSISDFSKRTVITPVGKAFVIEAPNGTPILSAGDPDLCKFTTSLIIPAYANMEAEIIASSYTDYPNIAVAPSKGNLKRIIDPEKVGYTYSNAYNENSFFPGNIVASRDPHIVRGQRGQTIILYPFQYNPVSKTLRVYNQLTVKIKVKDHDNPINPLKKYEKKKANNPEQQDVLKEHFLNYGMSKKDKETFAVLGEEGRMLIICYGGFMQAMQPFIDWKKQRGMTVEMINVSSIGNNETSIKNYVREYYDTTNLAFLLIVGDAPEVTTYISPNGPSDNSYAYVSGQDSYPDFFVGRFSGETVAEIETQVQRSIDYEKNPVAGATWYKKGLGYASDQGPGDDNEMDFEHIRNIRTELMNYTYNNIAELYDGSQGGGDAPGNPSNIDVFNEIQNGVGIINYTGHGSCTSSGTSGFSTSDVANLTNTGMLPFFISVACVNGEFTNTSEVCLAEKFMRQTYNGQPAGAIATLMSTINQSWSPPMEGQDEINAILTENFTNNIKRTFGGITMNGCMAMNDAYGVAGIEMTDTWTIFGDPSLEVRTNTPSAMIVDHATTASIGVDELTVYCSEENALVSLTKGGEILATGRVYMGMVNLLFSPIKAADFLTVTVTAYNKVPYMGAVDVSGINSGIKENLVANNVSLAPNPASTGTNLTYHLGKESMVSYTIYNAIGKPVRTKGLETQAIGEHTSAIELLGLTPGAYFLKFNAGDNTIVKRLLVLE